MTKEPWLTFGWTKTQYFQFIRSSLRRAFMRYPAGYKALEPYTRVVEVELKNGKMKKQKQVECQMCKNWFLVSHVQMDHHVPCGTLKEYGDLEGFVSTLYCGTDNLVPLCKATCHPLKTLADKNGTDIATAVIAKKIIEAMKQKVSEQVAQLRLLGYTDVSNTDKRKIAYADYYNKEQHD